MKFNRQALTWVRIHRGWTQAELAKRVGLSRPYINQIESGVREPSPPALAELARALGVEISEFFTSEVTCPQCGYTFSAAGF